MHGFHRKIILFFALIGICLATSSCGNFIASGVAPDEFKDIGILDRKLELADPEKYSVSIANHWSDGDSLYLVDYAKVEKQTGKYIGRYLRLSKDEGETFGEEKSHGDLFGSKIKPIAIWIEFLGEGIAALIADRDSNIFFSRSEVGLERFTKAVFVNDSPKSASRNVDFAVLDESRFCVVWTDFRNSEARIYSSFSTDRGQTWSINLPIDRELDTRKQIQPDIAVAGNGRLALVWEDWRDDQTLVDIRFAYSDDLGRSWSSSKKINDDSLAVWQIFPAIAANDNVISVTFGDFRENGEFDDRDWNVFYARSTDNAETWEKNKRLNNISLGRQENGAIMQIRDNVYYSVYSSTEKTVFGQMMLAVSRDSTQSWSKGFAITNANAKITGYRTKLVPLRGGIAAVQHYGMVGTLRLGQVTFVGPGGRRFDEEEHDIANKPKPIEVSEGDVYFSDDFSGVTANQWKPFAGVWKITNGEYIGTNSPSSDPTKLVDRFVSFAESREPENYIIKGRFKLDEISHNTASIYVRSGAKREFVITNQFRRGAWMAVQDSGKEFDGNIINGASWTQKHLAEKRFSFQAGKWYRFRLVVTKDQVDYYIDGERFFSELITDPLPPGKIGLGGHYHSPSHFDDIEIVEFDR